MSFGLDLGTPSLGWTVIDLSGPDGEPCGIRAAGVRNFDAGVDGDHDAHRELPYLLLVLE